MGLETFGFINDLVSTNPVGATDTKAQGDDHLRGIKSTLKANFPNATAAFYFPVSAAKTTAYTIIATDQNAIILADATAAAFTLTLTAAATLGARFRFTVIKTDSSANAVTIDGNAAETINGATTQTLSRQYQSATFVCNGTTWYMEHGSLATTVGPGEVELATTTEILTGTDTARAVTPDALAALWEKGVDEASAATVAFGEGGYFHITGAVTITDIDWDTAKNGRMAWVIFDAALTLTHNGTTLLLPGAANITTAIGDRALFVQDSTDNVYCLAYIRADGTEVIKASTTEVLTGTDANKAVTSDALAALWEKGTDEASAGTVAFDEGGYFHITGTTTITDIDWTTAKNGRMAWVVFDGALTLTHNATTLILPGGANITTAIGDRALFVQDATDNVYCLAYIKADGRTIFAASATQSGDVELATTTETLTSTDSVRAVTPAALAALWEKGANEASAGTVAFGEGGYFHITGVTTITDIDWDVAVNGRMAWVVFDGILTLTHNGTTLLLPGGANITTAANDRALFVQDSTDNVYCLAYVKANGKPVIANVASEITSTAQAEGGLVATNVDAALLELAIEKAPVDGMLFGLTLSNNGVDATNDIDIAAGVAADSTAARMMRLAAGITKRLDAAWAVGTAQGGLDTGVIANTTYHVFLIQRTDTNVVDVLFSTSATAPTMPANYTLFRRIGSIVRLAAAIKPFRQRGNYFQWVTKVQDRSDVADLAYQLVAITVPTGLNVQPLLAWTASTTTDGMYAIISDGADTGQASDMQLFFVPATAGRGAQIVPGGIFTNTSAQIHYQVEEATTIAASALFTHGWIDDRGQSA